MRGLSSRTSPVSSEPGANCPSRVNLMEGERGPSSVEASRLGAEAAGARTRARNSGCGAAHALTTFCSEMTLTAGHVSLGSERSSAEIPKEVGSV